VLVRYFVENFLSFKDECELSFIPGRSSKFPEHIENGNINILRTAVIYGANASGKSNLIKSMDFARNLILHGTKTKESIPVNRFKLNDLCKNKPAKFQFDIKYKDKYYSYGFSVDQLKVNKEWLYEIKSKKNVSLLFERTTNDKHVAIKFGNIFKHENIDKEFIEFIRQGTRPNQLFLTECEDRNIEVFSDVYEWFYKVLVIVFPQTKPMGFESIFLDDNGKEIKELFNNLIKKFDTGIQGFKLEKFKLESAGIPDFIIEDLKKDIKKNIRGYLKLPDNKRYCVYKNEADELVGLKLMAVHKVHDSEENIYFELEDESDGTRRLTDILPLLAKFTSKTIIFDELDRSLHPLITRKIIELFLENTDSQFIATTHDSSLLDLNLLRKDAIWFISKNSNEESKLYSLEEFKKEYGNNLQNAYLKGRFGAIPIISNKQNVDEI